MKKRVVFLILFSFSLSSVFSQSYTWTTTKNGIFRNGTAFYLKGQSWAKMTEFTYNNGTANETEVKLKLTELNAIGVNTIRVYGSPDDSDWSGSSNFGNLIKWIEEWNVANPDGGDPNKAMYYMVQINPADDESTLTDDLPHNTTASFARAISDLTNPGSVASLVNTVNTASGGSKYLLGYLIYHELNGSTKYVDWYNSIGASGIEKFMNAVADALHNTYAPGKLVSHTGDAKTPTVDIYQQIESLDGTSGNVFAKFDLIGFNLYISTDQMLDEGTYYARIVQRRGFSVTTNRGWYIGETGASTDVAASTSIPAVNYTQSQALANLQIMWQKSDELGNLIGFMMFTVQDNDLGVSVSDNMKQRGHFDYYGDKKFLYYAYPDVINEISTNNRYHSTTEHALGVTIVQSSSTYTITFTFQNKTSSSKQFYYSVKGDDGSSSQRFSSSSSAAYVTVAANQTSTVVKTVTIPSSNKLFAVEAFVIKTYSPSNSYSYGRDHILSDAIGTVAGLNLNTSNLPDIPADNYITVSPTSMSFSASSSSQNVTVSSNVSWTASDNATWLTLSPSSGTNNGTISVTASANTSTSSRSGTVTITDGTISKTINVSQSGSTSSALPSPWISSDVGAVAATGSASYSSGTFSINGSGADIWGTADEFRYVYQNVSGDVTITARVASVQNTNAWAKAGVMVRESLVAGSKHAMSVITPSNGTSFQRRLTTGGTSSHTTISSISAPYWVRIVRSGNTFTAYYSANGSTWTSNGSVTISMSSSVYVGLATTSHNDGTLCSATIDNVTVTSASATVPIAPSNLTASGISTSQINLTWSDNSADENNFVIEQSLNGVDTWSQIASLSANTTAYSNTGLIAAKTYYYRVYASNSTGNSNYSSIASATTKTEATGGTITLNPTDDAYVRGGAYAGNNFGSETVLVVKQGSVSDYFRKSYLQFDIATAGIADVSSAIVRLYASSVNSSTITAYGTTDAWDESTVTWSSAPAEGSSLNSVVVSAASQYYEWDITSYVQTESVGDGIVSLVFYDAAASNLQTIFSSKEAGSNMPQLVIVYGTSLKSALSINGNSSQINSLELYPNPVKDLVYLKNLEEGYTHYSIYNLMGSLIQTGILNSSEIKLNDTNSGEMLILRISGDNKQIITKRIVIQ
jgi:regulation of enolase protein 1 (concanavalin A-like superfamily)